MSRILAACALGFFMGLTLLFSELRVFRRVGLVERLQVYTSAGRRRCGGGLLSVATFKEVLAPLSSAMGTRFARVFRVSEELEIRLERIHSPLTVTAFRMRQLGWSTAALVVGAMFAMASGAGAAWSVSVVLGAPTLVFLVLEQQVAGASQQWQRRIFLELPVVTEQLGMLLSAGWSLGSAMARVSERGAGACATDLRRALARVRQGLSEVEALREWAQLADVPALHRLVAVLALNHETADIGRLIGEEARAVRQEAQRDLIETIEKRTQQVWIPVTAATLIPGVMLMGVPFIDALTLFSA